MDSTVSPYQSQSELLTTEYYAWDYRQRGYDLWPYPVTLEPPFRPFQPSCDPTDVSDDTRKHTLLSGLVARAATWFSDKPPSPVVEDEAEGDEFLADLYVPEEAIVEFQIALPQGIDYSTNRMELFLRNCKGAQHPMCMEFIGTGTQVVVQMVCREADAGLVIQQLKALFSDAIITYEPSFLGRAFDDHVGVMAAVDFALDQECAIPLAVTERADIDPLATVIAALATASDYEVVVLQIMFAPTRAPWGEAISHSLQWPDGSSFFADAPELLGYATEKTGKPLFSTLIRTCAKARDRERAESLLKRLGSSLLQFNIERRQGLIPLSNDEYPDDIHVDDICERITHRSGMILNITELSAFAHLPQRSITNSKLVRVVEKSKKLPHIALGHSLVLGTNVHRGVEKTVSLSPEHRMRHTYIVGASGTGKSTLLSHLLYQDIIAGRGVALLDPHGDLVDEMLLRIPEERCNDVVLFDPSDEEYPVGFNILEARSEAEKTLIASDLVATFRRLSSSWGDQMNAVLANSILAILEHENGGTLMTLRRFLVEKDFRKKYLTGIEDSEVRYYWNTEFPLLRGNSPASILTRLDAFMRSKIVRNMVVQQHNKIDFASVMAEQKIFLAKLPQGAIGEENASLLGTLLVTALNQAAQRRQVIETEDRVPFYVYIDEFQNFVTPTMESILSGSRKFGMALTLAHQDLKQLTSRNSDVASSVLSNPSTRICFRSGDADAMTLAKGFSSFDAQDLQSLGIGEAIARIEQSQYDFNLRVPAPLELPKESMRKEIISLSRAAYATDKETVESSIRSLYGDGDGTHNTKAKLAQKRDRKNPAQGVSRQSRQTERLSNAYGPHETPIEESRGRGGAQHKYLQSLIKKLALDRGFGAETEAAILGGHGAIDVLLTHGKSKIACEITISTPAVHEVQNIQKCLAAGIDSVVLIGQSREKLRSVRSLLKETFDSEILDRIQILVPDEFLAYLDIMQANAKQNEKRVRGYKVNVSYTSTTKAEQKTKQQAIAKLIVDSMRRLQDDCD